MVDFYVRLTHLCDVLGVPEDCGDRVARVSSSPDGWRVSLPGATRAPWGTDEQAALTDEQGYTLLIRGL